MTAAKSARKKPGPPKGSPAQPQLAKAQAAAAKAARARPKRTVGKAATLAKLQATIHDAQKQLAKLTEESGGVGAPTLYRPEFATRATGLCLLGLNNDELGARFGVSGSVIDDWIRDIKEFACCVYDGREGADEKVIDSLFRSARGYEHPEDDIRTVSLGDGQGSQIEITPTIKRYPPNQAAISLILANRQRKRWPHYPTGAGAAAAAAGDKTPQQYAADVQEAIRALDAKVEPQQQEGQDDDSDDAPSKDAG